MWLGLRWDGLLIEQSRRLDRYRLALERLHAGGLIFPCARSRRDVESAAAAPHDDEPLYPAAFRPAAGEPVAALSDPVAINWRFRVPDGRQVAFTDVRLGPKSAVAGRDFGDFLVWRKDDLPSYQLACVVDDAEFAISEVVRGEDLVNSTFRQILLQQALGLPTPSYLHTALVVDDQGQRLAKRSDSASLRSLRAQGATAESICESWRRKGGLAP